VKSTTLILTFLFFLSGCSNGIVEAPQNYVEDTESVIIEEEDVVEEVDPSTVYPFPNNPCVTCQWYFCPPLDSVWQKQICIDRCEEPPVIVHEGACEEYLECDPQQYLLDQVECVTEDGYPGTQKKVCNKGKIQYTECITDCQEESCNYIDDDCDGDIDEGQLNECGQCGVVPAEECNNIDDNCNGEVDEDLTQSCSTDCGTGYEMCIEGNWVSCTAPQPKQEICDGLDNDCDGNIDEDLECVCTIQDVGVLFPCQDDPLICGEGYKTCECKDASCTEFTMSQCFAPCHWFPNPNETCDPLIGEALESEKCNNFDDNCNQLVDEDLYAACYTGPEGTVMTGICLPGEVTCQEGVWGNYDQNEQFVPFYCAGEVVPQEEICNGLDDDCDGIVDWGEEMKETDVVFIVDWSGSMDDEIAAVMTALNQFAQYYSDEEVIKWAFMRGPVTNPPDFDFERLELQQNLIGFTDYLASLASMDVSSFTMQTSMEMILDAIYLAVHNITTTLPKMISDFSWIGVNSPGLGVVESSPELQNFKINWRPNADRIIIVFTDEKPQTYLHPPLDVQEAVTAVSGTPQLKLYTFTKSNVKTKWEALSIAGNGEWFLLTSSPTEMYANLMEILSDICKGDTDEN
tara:strand:- start:270 stop:2159 length:1890 start_codon:yes stop_codon:yes gene_type:complete